LDRIRPEAWSEQWTTELLELVSVLQSTIELLSKGEPLLDEILSGQMVLASTLPPVPDALRQVPVVMMTRAEGGLMLDN
jgi:hypothetical protein